MVHHSPSRARSVVVSAAVALAIGACSDATAPASDVAVTVSITQLNGPSVDDLGAGNQQVTCAVQLRATASGKARANWGDATLLFYVGSNRSKPVDSTRITAADVQSSWGAADIGPGETQLSGLSVSAPVPFGAALIYRYQPRGGGSIRSTRVTFTCGPDVPPLSRPPTITDVTVLPSGTEIESGAALTVHFIAQSDVGLWTSAVRVSGACTLEQDFSEGLQQRSEHSATLAIPAACTLGGTLSFHVTATNAALQTATVRGPRSFSVVDRTPPTVFADHLPAASDVVFVGDTLRPFIAAQDNYAVRSIIWEIQPGGLRDSINGAGGQYIAIPIRPEWAGTSIRVRLFARDASGLVSDTLVAPIAGLPIYPTVQRPMSVATINGDIEDLAFDEKRGAVYLIQAQNSVRIGVVSVATMSITETIPEQTGAQDLDLTPGGDSLVLALPYQQALGIIDLRQSPRTIAVVPVQSLDTATQQAPWQVRVGANGKAYVIVQGPTPAPSALLEVDLATHAERVISGTAGIAGARFERSFDRSVLLFSRYTDLLARYDVTNDVFGPIHTPHGLYGPLRVDDHGATVTVGLDVYDSNLDFQRRVSSVYGGEAIPGAALSKDGAYLYQALGYRGVARVRTSDGSVVDRFVVPFAASSYLRVSPDGNTLIVVDSFLGTARIALVDLR